jgi:hypothetical protein
MPRQASDEYSNTYEKCISDPESQSLSPDSARTSIQSPGRQAKNITHKAYITGFIPELIYPNQVNTGNTISGYDTHAL